jgi:hypothetical protein
MGERARAEAAKKSTGSKKFRALPWLMVTLDTLELPSTIAEPALLLLSLATETGSQAESPAESVAVTLKLHSCTPTLSLEEGMVPARLHTERPCSSEATEDLVHGGAAGAASCRMSPKAASASSTSRPRVKESCQPSPVSAEAAGAGTGRVKLGAEFLQGMEMSSRASAVLLLLLARDACSCTVTLPEGSAERASLRAGVPTRKQAPLTALASTESQAGGALLALGYASRLRAPADDAQDQLDTTPSGDTTAKEPAGKVQLSSWSSGAVRAGSSAAAKMLSMLPWLHVEPCQLLSQRQPPEPERPLRQVPCTEQLQRLLQEAPNLPATHMSQKKPVNEAVQLHCPDAGAQVELAAPVASH